MALVFYKDYMIVHTARILDSGEVPLRFIPVAAILSARDETRDMHFLEFTETYFTYEDASAAAFQAAKDWFSRLER